MARHSMETVPSMQVVRGSITDEVEDLVMQSLEKTPADRFQTMKEFAERLSEAEAEAAMARTAARRASSGARRASGQRSGAHGRRTGSREVPATERRSPVEVVAAAFREGGIKFWSFAAGGLLLLAGLGFGIWKAGHHGTTPSGAADSGLDPKHIAVLYFQQRGGSDSLGYLADGLTEALIHELSQVKPLQVVSGNGVAPYKNSNVSPDSIARALRVGTILQGAVAQSGNRLRVNVSLVNTANGAEIGSTTIERPREEIFALQDDLAKEVAVFLRMQLGQEVELRQTRASTSSPAAWDVLQQAERLTKEVDTLLATGDTAAAARHYAQADSMMAAAEKLDPHWATPAVERAWLAYHQSELVGYDKALNEKWIGIGMGHADRALKLRPNDPDALEIRGTLEYWRWLMSLEPDQTRAAQLLAQAEQDLRGAVTANPTAAWAWTVLSFLLNGEGQTAESKLAAQRSYEADPYLKTAKQTVWRLFQASLDLEDAVEARHWCEQGQQRFPDYYRFAECQIWLYSLKAVPPDVKAAWADYDRFVKLSPPALKPYHQLYGRMLVAMALVRAGLPDSARAVAVRSRGDATLDPTHDLAYYEALMRVLLGDQDEALTLLSTYVAANPQMRETIGKDQTWWMRDIRDTPRFKSLFGSAN
jgi:TolB-like protein